MQPQDEIERRLARYAVTRDARDLWPEVSPSAFRSAQEEIARVARAVLTDAGRPVHFDGGLSPYMKSLLRTRGILV